MLNIIISTIVLVILFSFSSTGSDLLLGCIEHDIYKYCYHPDGYKEIYKGDKLLTRQGMGLTGTVGGEDYIYTTLNFTWSLDYEVRNMSIELWYEDELNNTIYYNVSVPCSLISQDLGGDDSDFCNDADTGGGTDTNITSVQDVKDQLGYYVNMTSATHNGSWVSGGLTGYEAGNDLCNTNYPGTHACWAHEIGNHFAYNRSFTNFTGTFWINELAPGFLADANDCGGHTTDAATALGAIQVGNIIDGGTGSLLTCGASRSIGCCR